MSNHRAKTSILKIIDAQGHLLQVVDNRHWRENTLQQINEPHIK